MDNKYDTTWKYAQAIVGTSPGRPEGEFYPTPEIATLKLLGKEEFPGHVLEPACGDGAISKVLEDAGYIVTSSDLYNHGYGETGIDFLGDHYTNWKDNGIITNPPFKLLEDFIEKCVELRCKKFALFAKLTALEGKKRSHLLEKTYLSSVWVFRSRLTLTRNGEKQRNSGMIAFAWYVWEEGYYDRPRIGWI